MLGGKHLLEGAFLPTRSRESLSLGAWQFAGAAYFFGQLFAVESLDLNSPGVVFAVKAIEPLSTAVLAIPVFNKGFDMQLFLAIFVSCLGISVTAYSGSTHGDHAKLSGQSATHFAVLLAMLSNVGYSSRSCVLKKAMGHGSTDPLEPFGKITIAATQVAVMLVILWAGLGFKLLHPAAFRDIILELHLRPSAWFAASVAYFLYQAASILLLSCFAVETHALLVALKHVFVVVLASVMTHHAMNSTLIGGLVAACVGVCWYAYSQRGKCSSDDVPDEPDVPEDNPLLPKKSSQKLQDVPSKLPVVLCAVVATLVFAGSLTPFFQL